ncbi:MAG: GNAT family N-acetyltransferase [Proteobacteria bacterium]|nr:GNAT family N-acetyltransferase [Pseudomonadota bacterium]
MYSRLQTRNGSPIDPGSLVIDSERLRLRPVTLSDARPIYEYFNKDITRYMVPKVPECIEDAEQFINDAIEGVKTSSNLQFAVCNKSQGDFLGCCGLHKLDNDPAPETGIWIRQNAHGQGYGREAVTAIKTWAQQMLDYPFLIYPVDKDNTPSRHLVETLGGQAVDGYTVNNAAGRQLNIIVYRISLI